MLRRPDRQRQPAERFSLPAPRAIDYFRLDEPAHPRPVIDHHARAPPRFDAGDADRRPDRVDLVLRAMASVLFLGAVGVAVTLALLSGGVIGIASLLRNPSARRAGSIAPTRNMMTPELQCKDR